MLVSTQYYYIFKNVHALIIAKSTYDDQNISNIIW